MLGSLPTHRGRVSPTTALREAIKAMPDRFSMPKLADWISQKYPDAVIPRVSLSSALTKLRQMNEIEQIEAPAGREPAVYKLKRSEVISSANGSH
jgi:hypothetical protein